MNPLEKTCVALRHTALLQKADWLWDAVRPAYDRLVKLCSPHGLQRVINGTDPIALCSEMRGVGETYEPELWAHVMRRVEAGDRVADVGAFIGLYALAVGKRVGPVGRVTAFEPDQRNCAILRRHIQMNGLSGVVKAEQAALGAADGEVWFTADRGSENQLARAGQPGAQPVPAQTLDTYFTDQRLDLLKLDVEGFEEDVLKGGELLLSDAARAPRLIYVEVHPYNWHHCGTTSESFLGLLRRLDYAVEALDGTPVNQIAGYGHVVARGLRDGTQ
jgi:FkbM family methyltransferase